MTTKNICLVSTFLAASVGIASAQQATTPPPFVFVPEPLEHSEHHAQVYTDADGTHHHFKLAQDFKAFKVDVKPFKVELDQFTQLAAPFRQEKNQSDGWYSQARGYIDRDQYERALEPLERVIAGKGARADAATYWKAYSLSKLSRRDEALSALGQLQKQFPDSRWVRDARALEVEIKQASGQSVTTETLNDELKLLALQGITRTDPEAAFPVVEKMLAGGSSVRIKERALFVVSQSRSDRAREILANVARGNANPDLQQSAIRYLGIQGTPEATAALTAVYKAETSVDMKRAVISALMMPRNTTAISALVTLARGERDPELKTAIVRHLATSNSPEAKSYMLEILK
jgi:tetratricopeptide (TPR) repeat protein